MKPVDFDYIAPPTIDGALEALSSSHNAKLLAGGQSLIPLLNLRLAQPDLLVDLRQVPGITRIEAMDGRVRIGAMTRQRDAEEDTLLAEHCPLVVEALRHVGHPQIRARGTVGGSIAHADPAAELPAVLLALDGIAHVVGPGGARTIEAAELFRGFLTTSMEPDEILVAVDLPVVPPHTGVSCVEVALRDGDYALCGVLAQITVGVDGKVREGRVALFGVEDRPVRARTLEDVLVGAVAASIDVRKAARRTAEGLRCQDDFNASADYRRHLAAVLMHRAIAEAAERAL
jgi:aerobic carbon-monoxide dehydrogenase medium subunit